MKKIIYCLLCLQILLTAVSALSGTSSKKQSRETVASCPSSQESLFCR